MNEIYAKPVVDGKFWIVEQDGTKIATLHKKENNKLLFNDYSLRILEMTERLKRHMNA
jgi:hypothetical protein